MANLSHIIFYVKDIPKAIVFYKEAFGISCKFIHESNTYAELETGETILAFASESLGHSNLTKGYTPNDINKLPLASEIVFTVENVDMAFDKAIQSGALPLSEPQEKPWGQLVAYVRDVNGVLIEIASPISK